MHLTIRPAATMKAAAAARSASLPHEHSHPVLARLDDGIRALRSCSASASSSGLTDQIALVDAVLAALGELLALPQAEAALHDAAACDQILDGFLVLADVYGEFESALLELKQSAAELQVGTRRGDGAMVSASLRAHRRTEKELCRLAATMRHASRCAPALSRPADVTDSEVIDIVAEAAAATVEASEAIFLGSAATSLDVQAMAIQKVSSNKWMVKLGVRPAAKKAVPKTAASALEMLEQLEERIGELERGSQRVFRRLLRSRVSLLNMHRPF